MYSYIRISIKKIYIYIIILRIKYKLIESIFRIFIIKTMFKRTFIYNTKKLF